MRGGAPDFASGAAREASAAPDVRFRISRCQAKMPDAAGVFFSSRPMKRAILKMPDASGDARFCHREHPMRRADRRIHPVLLL
jgi:hypothetical protein